MKRKMLSGLCLVCVVLVMAGACFSAIPKKISFQGRLLSSAGTPVSDGNYSITFKIYDASSGGAALWTETQTVATTSGYYNVVLGSTTAITLAFDKDYWISVQVGTDAEMSPRFYLGASGYCINADTLDGVDSSAFVQLTGGNLLVGNPAVTTAKVSALETGTGNTAGYFSINNSSNGNSALASYTTGTAAAGAFEISNTSNSASLIIGTTSGTGNLLTLQKSSSNKFVVDNSGAITTGAISWSKLTSVPAGFADGVDDTGSGGSPWVKIGDFSSGYVGSYTVTIPTDYKAIRIFMRFTTTSAGQEVLMRFNGDSSNNYFSSGVRNGGYYQSVGGIGIPVGRSSGASVMGQSEILIGANKSVTFNASQGAAHLVGGGYWGGSSSITSVTFVNDTDPGQQGITLTLSVWGSTSIGW